VTQYLVVDSAILCAGGMHSALDTYQVFEAFEHSDEDAARAEALSTWAGYDAVLIALEESNWRLVASLGVPASGSASTGGKPRSNTHPTRDGDIASRSWRAKNARRLRGRKDGRRYGKGHHKAQGSRAAQDR